MSQLPRNPLPQDKEDGEQEMLATLNRKRAELSALLSAKARLEEQIADERGYGGPHYESATSPQVISAPTLKAA
eukprot:scaffold73310_cov31-Tisochrysis_lutea.AAC.2